MSRMQFANQEISGSMTMARNNCGLQNFRADSEFLASYFKKVLKVSLAAESLCEALAAEPALLLLWLESLGKKVAAPKVPAVFLKKATVSLFLETAKSLTSALLFAPDDLLEGRNYPRVASAMVALARSCPVAVRKSSGSKRKVKKKRSGEKKSKPAPAPAPERHISEAERRLDELTRAMDLKSQENEKKIDEITQIVKKQQKPFVAEKTQTSSGAAKPLKREQIVERRPAARMPEVEKVESSSAAHGRPLKREYILEKRLISSPPPAAASSSPQQKQKRPGHVRHRKYDAIASLPEVKERGKFSTELTVPMAIKQVFDQKRYHSLKKRIVDKGNNRFEMDSVSIELFVKDKKLYVKRGASNQLFSQYLDRRYFQSNENFQAKRAPLKVSRGSQDSQDSAEILDETEHLRQLLSRNMLSF